MAMKCGIHFFYFEAEIVDPSKISPPRVSWERDDISDVIQTSSEKDHPLKAKAETTVLDRSKAPEVHVPLIWLQRQTRTKYPVEQDAS
jgi:hypothetical protein